MTALAIERSTIRMDSSGQAIPDKFNLALATGQSGFQGGIACLNAAGQGVNASAATALIAVGRWTGSFSASLAGATMDVEQGVFKYANGAGVDAIAATNIGQVCFVIDDQTVGLTNGGGARSPAGIIQQVDSDGVWVQMGIVFSAIAGVMASLGGEGGGSTPFKARAVVTSLAAYTGTGTNVLTASVNGAWAAQDGVTNAVGDVVFIPATTTNLVGAVDSGPWQITSLGGAAAKWTLQRPSWFQTGESVPIGASIDIGGEGTAWAGNTWRSFAAVGSAVVGTNDPVFYPRFTSVTTAAMTAGVSAANSTLFVRPLAIFAPLPATPGGAQGILRMSTSTAGYPGTSSLVVTSSSNTDTSTVKIQVINF